MASHLGWPVWIIKRFMPYTEFIMWQAYLDHEQNTPGKLEYYIAQLTAAVVNPYMPKGRSVTLKDFLNPVKFIRGKEKRVSKTDSTIRAKTFLAGAFGSMIRKKK